MIVEISNNFDECPQWWINFVKHYRSLYSADAWIDISERVLTKILADDFNVIVNFGQYFVKKGSKTKLQFDNEEHYLFFVLSWS